MIIMIQKMPCRKRKKDLRQGIHSTSFTSHHLRRDRHQDQGNRPHLQRVEDIPYIP
jgi:hypothetical protein